MWHVGGAGRRSLAIRIIMMALSLVFAAGLQGCHLSLLNDSTGSAAQEVSAVSLQGDRLLVGGKGLDGVTAVSLSGPAGSVPLELQQQSATLLTLAASPQLKLALGTAYQLLVQSAAGDTPVSVVFQLQDGSVGPTQLDRAYLEKSGGTLTGALTVPGLTVTGGMTTAIANKTANYTLTATDSVVTADAIAGAVTLTLPTAIGATGRAYTLKKIDTSANAVTVATTGGQTIDGTTTFPLLQRWATVSLVSDGANWVVSGAKGLHLISFGTTTQLPTDDSNNSGQLLSQREIFVDSMTVKYLHFYVKTPSGHLRLGLYSDSAGYPGTLLAATAEFVTVGGWNVQPVTTPVMITPGTYWLAYAPEDNTLVFETGGVEDIIAIAFAYGALPPSFPAGGTDTGTGWSFYASGF